jgi:hypothetical protein
MKKQIGNMLWWIGTLDLVLGALVIISIALIFGNAGKFLPFVGAMLVFSVVMWVVAWLLGGAVWVPWRRQSGDGHLRTTAAAPPT